MRKFRVVFTNATQYVIRATDFVHAAVIAEDVATENDKAVFQLTEIMEKGK